MRTTATGDGQPIGTLIGDSADDLRSACTRQHNVLLQGPELATSSVLGFLKPYLRDPVAWFVPGTPFDTTRDEGGALIVPEVAALTPSEQAQLLQWLDAATYPVQIVCTTRHSLYARVTAGQFDESLYYRLNTVLLRLGE